MMNNQSSDKQGAECPLPIEAYITIFDCLDYLQDHPDGLDDSHTEQLLNLVTTYLPSEAENALDMLRQAYNLLDQAMYTLTKYPRQLSLDEMEEEGIKAEIAKAQAELKDITDPDTIDTYNKGIAQAQDRLAQIRKERVKGKSRQRDMLHKLEKAQGKNRFRIEQWISSVAKETHEKYDDIAALPYPEFIRVYNRLQCEANLELAQRLDQEAEQRRQQSLKQ